MGVTRIHDQHKAERLAVDMAKQVDLGDIHTLFSEFIDVEHHNRLYRAVNPDHEKYNKSHGESYEKLKKIVGPKHHKLLIDHCNIHTAIAADWDKAAFHMAWALAIQLFTLKPAGRKLVKRGKP
jgi:hypothetical protein